MGNIKTRKITITDIDQLQEIGKATFLRRSLLLIVKRI